MPQSAVVLGGGSEIAGRILVALAKHRLQRVVLVCRPGRPDPPVLAELEGLGVSVETVAHDLTETEGLDALAASAEERLGRVDLVLVAAGQLGTAELDELDAASTAALIAANFTGPAAATLAFAKRLVVAGAGVIVVLSSVAGVRVRRSNFVYGAAKAGLDGFSEGLGDLLADKGVDVMVVRPGFVRTKMTAGRREMPLSVGPDEVARAVVSGLERGSEVVFVPGAFRLFTLTHLLPRPLWRRLPF